VETAIGVFDSHDKAGEALRELLRQSVPRECIFFLTRSENEAMTVAQELGGYAEGFVNRGFLAELTALTPLVIAGLGQVYTLGSGANALLARGCQPRHNLRARQSCVNGRRRPRDGA